MSQRARAYLRWIGGAAGLVLLVILLRRLGWRTLADAFARVGPGILWLAALYAAATVLMALPWALLLPRARRPGPVATVSSRFAAAGLNALLPFLALGEASRLLWLRRSDRAEGAAAIIVDRLLFMVASAVAVSAGAAAIWVLPHTPRSLALIAAAGAAALAVTAAAAALALRAAPATWLRRVVRRIRRGLLRLPRGPEDADELGVERVDAAVRELLGGRPGRLLAALALHLGGRVFVTLEVLLACRLLGVEAGALHAIVLAAVPLVLAIVAAVVPSQIGVQEGAQALVASAIGLPASAGLLVVLLQRGRQLLFLPVTAVLLAVRPDRAASPSSRHVAPHLPS